MKISFIIATVSVARSHKLQQCMASIEKAHDRARNVDIEILIVFQDVVDLGAMEISHPGCTVFFNIKERGLSRARNFAIGKSSGEYLVFLDDDAGIQENFLDVLLNTIRHNSADSFCGKIVDPANGLLYADCFLYPEVKALGRREFAYFMGSAHVLKRSAIVRIGLYDERFGAGAKYPAAEESDVFFRLMRGGSQVVYLPELVFYHPINNQTTVSKRFDYSMAHGAMLAKQIIMDARHSYIYASIIFENVAKCLVRTLQVFLFPKSIMVKNMRFQYKSVLTGTLKGFWVYLWNS